MDGVNNNLKINQSGDANSLSETKRTPKQTRAAISDAQVVSGAEAGTAARLHVAGQINPKSPDEIEVATLGIVKVSDEQLRSFAERVSGGVLRQEAQILDAVNTFAGKDRTLRDIVSSTLLAI